MIMETTREYVARTLKKVDPPLTERELVIADTAVIIATAYEETLRQAGFPLTIKEYGA